MILAIGRDSGKGERSISTMIIRSDLLELLGLLHRGSRTVLIRCLIRYQQVQVVRNFWKR